MSWQEDCCLIEKSPPNFMFNVNRISNLLARVVSTLGIHTRTRTPYMCFFAVDFKEAKHVPFLCSIMERYQIFNCSSQETMLRKNLNSVQTCVKTFLNGVCVYCIHSV